MRSRCISILGSTGSVGTNSLKIVDSLGDISVAGLASGQNVELLAQQVAKYSPKLVSCGNESASIKLARTLAAEGIETPKILYGEEGLCAVAMLEEVDTVISATVGAVGFVPTLKALEAGKRVALANKETLVMAGELMISAANRSNAEILPVDSEHNAIHQCLKGEKRNEVAKIILTASGGPFRESKLEEIEAATLEEALAHPTWEMGDKISIDSATLMNKGLEVVEAHWLFGFDAADIDVIVHPQSVVHSMIEMIDGSVIAQMGITDMRHPIQYSLTYPSRENWAGTKLALADIGTLTFEKPDYERFPNLRLAYRALKMGGTTPAALNASNEIAVAAFLDRRIRLTDIARLNTEIVDSHKPKEMKSLEVVKQADRIARRKCESLIDQGVLQANV